MSYSSDLYQQVILDHNRKPRNFFAMEDSTHHCEGYNPLCGDKITVYLKVGNGGVIEDISFNGSGCAISKSSASMMTAFLKGKTIDTAKSVFESFHAMVTDDPGFDQAKSNLGKLAIFEGVREYPSRIKCATLSWHTLISAIDDKKEAQTE